MVYQLPKLPYSFDALEPVISKEIMELHYEKHHRGYVTNLNAALEKYAEAEKKQDLQQMVALQSAIKFNGGGHVNHSIFWTNLCPQSEGGGELPKGDLAQAVEKQFGSFDSLIEAFNALAGPIQGSGWGWLGLNPKTKTLALAACSNQDPLSTQGLIPLLGIDVWEHAYYLQYKNVRPDYLKNIWKVVNWKNVSERYESAVK